MSHLKEKEKKIRIKNNRKKDKKEKNIFNNKDTIMSLLVPEAIQECRDYIYLGEGRYSRVFILTIFPKKVYLGWLDDVFYKMGDINISIVTECSNESTVVKQLTSKVVELESQYQTFKNQGNIKDLYNIETMIEDFEDMRRSVQTEHDKVFYVTILLKLNTESLEELDRKSKVLKDEFSQMFAKLRTLTFRQSEGFKATLPINYNVVIGFERNFTTSRIWNFISNCTF